MIRKQPYSWSVKQVCSMMDKGTLIFDNPNQRPSGQWDSKDNKDKSLLIDSIFRMFIPDIITIIKKQEVNGKLINVYDVIDGQQRCNTLNDYRKDKFPLCDLEPVTLESTGDEYNISGLKYSELPEDIQSEIDSFTLIIRPIEVEAHETDEDVANMITYRLNNGKGMSREHMALLAAPANIRTYIRDTIKEHLLFTSKAHFPDGSLKKSGQQMAIMQSIVLAGGYEFSSFTARDVENALANVSVPDDILANVIRAFDMIANVFDDKDKFISKVNIPSFVYLLCKNNFDTRVIDFIRSYSHTISKNDPYKRYSSGTKKSDIDNRLRGLSDLYNKYKGV